MENLLCLIMAGGSGTRFWPRSRSLKPKQYLDIAGDQSLLQSTLKRFETITFPGNCYIVSNKLQSGILEEQATSIPGENLIYEPVGKNTLPCIGLSAIMAQKKHPDGIMIVSPSDHLIMDTVSFRETIMTAVKVAAEKDGIVTIGINPTYPATGYGYVKTGSGIFKEGEIGQYKVDRFIEKPDEATAAGYLKSGGYFWNSGMFIFKISVFLDAVQTFAPELYSGLRKIESARGSSSFEKTLETIYSGFESISVDYGIMEHARNIFLVEGNFDWNDLGSWESVYQVSEKDSNENATSGTGEALFIGSTNSFAHTDTGLVAIIGLDDVMVVRDGNAVLVCKRDAAENVKQAVECMKQRNLQQYL